MLSELHGDLERNDKLMSLEDIMLKEVVVEERSDEVETYIQLSKIVEELEENEYYERDKLFTVKRISMNYYDKNCHVLNFTNITS